MASEVVLDPFIGPVFFGPFSIGYFGRGCNGWTGEKWRVPYTWNYGGFTEFQRDAYYDLNYNGREGWALKSVEDAQDLTVLGKWCAGNQFDCYVWSYEFVEPTNPTYKPDLSHVLGSVSGYDPLVYPENGVKDGFWYLRE